VDSGLDTGPCVLQGSFARDDADDLASFAAKGRALEHKLFPTALDLAAAGKISLKLGQRWVEIQ